MNVILDDQIEFLKKILSNVVKGIDYYKGTLFQGTLYILAVSGIFYKIDVSSFYQYETFFDFEKKSGEKIEIFLNPTNIFNELFSIIEKIKSYENNCHIIYHEQDIRTNEEFENIIALKTNEGSGKLNINTELNHSTFMVIYKNIFNLSKPDTASLQIYNLGFGKLLSKFNVYKKKLNIKVDIYFVFLDMLYNGG